MTITQGRVAHSGEVRAPERGPLSGICVLSRDVLLATSDISIASNRRLRQLRDEAQIEADQERDALKTDAKAYEDGQAGLTPALKKQLAEHLSERTRNATATVSLRTRELERTRAQVTEQIEAAAAPIIREMARLNGCSMVITRESVISAPTIVDITQVVISAMNTRLQSTLFQRLSLTGNSGGTKNEQ